MLGHAALIAEARGFAPLLLLDELAVHLDPERRAALFAALRAAAGAGADHRHRCRDLPAARAAWPRAARRRRRTASGRAFSAPDADPCARNAVAAIYLEYPNQPPEYSAGMSENAAPQPDSDAYDAASISVLQGLDAVRKRPGMYIGDTDDGSGLHHMAFEIIDNAVDEAQAGFATQVELTLNGDGSVTVRDDGRGIPIDIHQEEGISAAEVVLTRLHAGGKFNQNSYKVSGGLHGVGAAVVNALSEWMEVRIWRHGEEHFIRFRDGDAEAPLAVVGAAPTGTQRHRGDLQAEPRHLHQDRVRLRPAGAPAARARLPELRPDHRAARRAPRAGGRERRCATTAAWSPSSSGSTARKTAVFTAADQPARRRRRAGHPRRVRAVVERQLPRDDAVLHQQHPAARRRHASRRLPPGADPRGDEIRRRAWARRSSLPLVGEDMREGMTAVLSVKVPDPKFSSQTKDKLVSSEVQPVVQAAVGRRRRALVRDASEGGRSRSSRR